MTTNQKAYLFFKLTTRPLPRWLFRKLGTPAKQCNGSRGINVKEENSEAMTLRCITAGESRPGDRTHE